MAAVNDLPVATNDTCLTAEDTPLIIAAPGVLDNDTDVDGDIGLAFHDQGLQHLPSHCVCTRLIYPASQVLSLAERKTARIPLRIAGGFACKPEPT